MTVAGRCSRICRLHDAALDEGVDVVDGEHVGLGLLESRGEIAELEPHLGGAPIDLDQARAEAVRQLVVEGELEEGLVIEPRRVLRRHRPLGDRPQDAVVLGLHDVLEHHLLGALRLPHPLVVGQVEGQGLDPGPAVARGEQLVGDPDRRLRPAVGVLVLVRDRQAALEGGQLALEALEAGRVLGVGHAQEGLEGRLVAEQRVLVGLVGPDDDLDGRVEVHPGQVGLVVVVAAEGRRAQLEEALEARVVGGRRGGAQLGRGPRRAARGRPASTGSPPAGPRRAGSRCAARGSSRRPPDARPARPRAPPGSGRRGRSPPLPAAAGRRGRARGRRAGPRARP